MAAGALQEPASELAIKEKTKPSAVQGSKQLVE
jgi:hypothetical protein